MRLFAIVSVAFALLAPAFAGPSTPLKAVLKSGGETKPNSYIVKLKDGVAKDAHIHWLSSKHGSSTNVTHPDWSSKVLHGYAGVFGTDALNALRMSPDVDYIEEDAIVNIEDTNTQENAPWGLQRISQDPPLPAGSNPNLLAYNYTYEVTAGEYVDIYIIDTGIRITHTEFNGRAKWGKTFGGYPDADGNGHGTHCAGTAAGRTYGVAKNANLIAVKVLSDGGSGSLSDVISGVDYVVVEAGQTGAPSIASMSLSSPPSIAVDNAVQAATIAGVHVVVAAGNQGIPASGRSPARAPAAVTVAASDIRDVFAPFSNYGPSVDIIAPGVSVISAWFTSDTAINIISGTSMATPHVAGLVACLISDGGNLLPEAMSDRLQQLATKNAISGVPPGTVNYLARNQV
nr:subtilisin-like serine protease precursor [Lignosus rhinocerotis]